MRKIPSSDDGSQGQTHHSPTLRERNSRRCHTMMIIGENGDIRITGTMIVFRLVRSEQSEWSRWSSRPHRHRPSRDRDDQRTRCASSNRHTHEGTNSLVRHSRYYTYLYLDQPGQGEAAYEEEVIRRYRVWFMTESVKNSKWYRDEDLRVSAPEKYSGEDDIKILIPG